MFIDGEKFVFTPDDYDVWEDMTEIPATFLVAAFRHLLSAVTACSSSAKCSATVRYGH